MPSSFKNLVGQLLVADRTRECDRSHHGCKRAGGDLACLLRGFFRKQPGHHVDHFVELPRKYTSRLLAGTSDVGTECRQHATMCAIIPMLRGQIRVDYYLKPMLDRYVLHNTVSFPNNSVYLPQHCVDT